ncbi:hypothetical protein H4R35_004080 [Dimargaris xerosporica]|nr:hypothetical protein H4R35_004080 [Dimargaris xerosporica]
MSPRLQMHARLAGHPIHAHLKQLPDHVHVYVHVDTTLKALDFVPYPRWGIVFLTAAEAATMSFEDIGTRLAPLKQCTRALVLVERTALAVGNYPNLQWRVVNDLDLPILPVPSAQDAARFVAQMAHSAVSEFNPPTRVDFWHTTSSNRCKAKSNCPVLESLQSIPNLGAKKSQLLYESTQSIAAVANTTTEVNQGIIALSASTARRQASTLSTASHLTGAGLPFYLLHVCVIAMANEYTFASKISRGLADRLYEKRKASALEVEKLIREQLAQKNQTGVKQILGCLVKDYAYSPQPHARSGGLIALATSAIAIGTHEVNVYLDDIVPPVLACFADHDTHVKYYACEAMYNISKVAKGEVLRFFNEVFDALSKTSADTDKSVKKGSELLNRLIVDIVSEEASSYVSIVSDMDLPPVTDPNDDPQDLRRHQRSSLAFSLERFMPLLTERVNTINPNTRVYLINWLRILDSLPELELIHYLPRFLRQIFGYLSDPNEEVRTVTNLLLSDFLVELGQIAKVKRGPENNALQLESLKRTHSVPPGPSADGAEAGHPEQQRPRVVTAVSHFSPISSDLERGSPFPTRGLREEPSIPHLTLDPNQIHTIEDQSSIMDDLAGAISDPLVRPEQDPQAKVTWVPRQTVDVDFSGIVQIVCDLLDSTERDIQHTALQWITRFIIVCPEVVITFASELIDKILPSLSHTIPAIKKAAAHANASLYQLIQEMPIFPSRQSQPATTAATAPNHNHNDASASSPRSEGPPIDSQPHSPALPRLSSHPASPTVATLGAPSHPTSPSDGLVVPSPRPSPRSETPTVAKVSTDEPQTPLLSQSQPTTPSPQDQRRSPLRRQPGLTNSGSPTPATEPFNFEATVTTLIVAYSNGREETRIACVDWLLMLHRKAPLRMAREETLVSNDGSFPVFLKIMSDPSEEVVKKNLQLLAQFSAYLDTEYFQRFMVKLLELFSTDRQLLENRGSLIIRRLCVSLNAELIYRTIAEILESIEDHEFASIMVQNLNTILITAPELAELRYRLKHLDTRDNQQLFATLYRSWCYSPVATFTLCLLAQAYEHAANMLPVFAEMEMTVALLIQVDKLVQLIESPVFTYLRLQLLEPDRYPYLYKCLYGVLMLLPQSSAFATLRSRLNSVSALGYLHVRPASDHLGNGPPPTPLGTASKRTKPVTPTTASASMSLGDSLRFPELLSHFRTMQLKHSKFTQNPDPPNGGRMSSNGGGGGPLSAVSVAPAHVAAEATYPTRRRNSNAGYRPSHLATGTGASSINSSGAAATGDDYSSRRSSASPAFTQVRGRSPSSMVNSSGTATSSRNSRGPLMPAVKAIRKTIGKR